MGGKRLALPIFTLVVGLATQTLILDRDVLLRSCLALPALLLLEIILAAAQIDPRPTPSNSWRIHAANVAATVVFLMLLVSLILATCICGAHFGLANTDIAAAHPVLAIAHGLLLWPMVVHGYAYTAL